MYEVRLALEAGGLVVAMLIAGYVGLERRLGAVLLAILSIVWFGADKDFEGAVLLKINDAHGIVLADVVGVLGLLAAALLWRRHRS